MLHKEIKKYLENLTPEQLVPGTVSIERQITNQIENILENNRGYKLTKEDIAEKMAFLFYADCLSTDMGWEKYFGPISEVNKEILEYWTKRAKESRHPILKQRYADLVIDLSPKILGKGSTDNDLFTMVIDSNIKICEEALTTPIDCETKAARAFNLAVYKHDSAQIAKTKSVIINLIKQKKTQGFILEFLVLNHKIFDKKEKADIVKQLEIELKEKEQDLKPMENIVFLLAEYYAKEEDQKNLMRILGVFENSWRTNKRSDSEALFKIHAYGEIQEKYKKYADMGFDDAIKANERISQEIKQLDLY